MSGQIVEASIAPQKLLFTQKFPIRWGDMDALCHVNNVQYLRYFEESRVAWCIAIGKPLTSTGEGMILLKSTVTYKKPVTYPANVVVELRAGAVGNSSFNLINTLMIEHETEPACVCELVVVWFDYVNNKTMRVPEDIRRLLLG